MGWRAPWDPTPLDTCAQLGMASSGVLPAPQDAAFAPLRLGHDFSGVSPKVGLAREALQ